MNAGDIKAALVQLGSMDIAPKCKHKAGECDLVHDPQNICADESGNVVVITCGDCGWLSYLHPVAAYDMFHHG